MEVCPVHELFQSGLTWYLHVLDQFGLVVVLVMMSLCGPGEAIMPFAAYAEVYKKSTNFGMSAMNFALVVLVGAIGYYISVVIVYAISRVVGRPLIVKYGKYILIPEKKLKVAEQWVAQYGVAGLLIAPLIPGIRHAICIPAGIIGMRFRTYSIGMFFGGLVWCIILAIFGLVMAKDMAVIERAGFENESPAFKHAMTNLTWACASLVAVMGTLYFLVMHGRKPHQVPAADALAEVES